jgi:hypothetical protein
MDFDAKQLKNAVTGAGVQTAHGAELKAVSQCAAICAVRMLSSRQRTTAISTDPALEAL